MKNDQQEHHGIGDTLKLPSPPSMQQMEQTKDRCNTGGGYGKGGGVSVDLSDASTHWTRRRVDAPTRRHMDSSPRRRVDASTRRRVEVSARRGVDASTLITPWENHSFGVR